jgi:hypothetical protein
MPEYDDKFFAQFPVGVSWTQAAEIVSRYEFQVAQRTLRTWGLPVTYPNGRTAVCPRDLMAEAVRRRKNAPLVSPMRENLKGKAA